MTKEANKENSSAQTFDVKVRVLVNKLLIGKSVFLKGAEFLTKKELADKLEADKKVLRVY